MLLENGVRFDLGPGEVTDIIVEDGKVYCVGYSYGGDATYWIDNEVFKLEGTGDEEAYAQLSMMGCIHSWKR